jgi:hypothetical protein
VRRLVGAPLFIPLRRGREPTTTAAAAARIGERAGRCAHAIILAKQEIGADAAADDDDRAQDPPCGVAGHSYPCF